MAFAEVYDARIWELKMKKEQNDEVIATQQQPNKDL